MSFWDFFRFKKRKREEAEALEKQRFEAEEARKKAEIEKAKQIEARKREEEEKRKKEAEEKERAKNQQTRIETVKNLPISKMQIKSPIISIDIVFSEQMGNVASQANFAINTKQGRRASDLLLQMYLMVNAHNGHKLLQIEDSQTQTTGLAFTSMALSFDNGDPDVNDVAAENAFYCLSRSFLKKNNKWTTPALFSMFYRKPKLFKDMIDNIMMGLIAVAPDNPNCMNMLAVICNHEDFHNAVMFFCLNQFYNINTKEYSIPTDMPYYIPNEQTINNFLNKFNKTDLSKNPNIQTIGYNTLVLGYNKCAYTLSRCV